MRKTKIVCTIGPATEDEETIADMIIAGMDVARINFSHGDYEEQADRIEVIKNARNKIGKPLALMMDTKGPEIRIGKFESGEIELFYDDIFTLVCDDIIGDKTKVAITYKNLSNEITNGTRILINDGLIECEVVSIEDKNIVCKVINGGKLTDRKSINIPGFEINLPSITDKDIEDIKFGIVNGFDYIAASFIRKPEDVENIRNVLRENNGEHIKIISKIENREGLENFDKILEASDGIMVARGDLGVEIPMEEVPIYQKEIIQKCCSSGKPVITATQMLETMIENPRPTRAEVSDIANAIYDQTSAIMLSAETATGEYPVECIETMDKIAKKIESSINYWQRFKTREYDLNGSDYEYYLNYSTCMTAMNLDAKAIFAYTNTGRTVKNLAGFLPKCPIYAITDNNAIYRQLSLVFGVMPIYVEHNDNIDKMVNEGVSIVQKSGQVNPGDLVAIAGGASILTGKYEANKDMNKTIGGVIRI